MKYGHIKRGDTCLISFIKARNSWKLPQVINQLNVSAFSGKYEWTACFSGHLVIGTSLNQYLRGPHVPLYARVHERRSLGFAPRLNHLMITISNQQLKQLQNLPFIIPCMRANLMYHIDRYQVPLEGILLFELLFQESLFVRSFIEGFEDYCVI